MTRVGLAVRLGWLDQCAVAAEIMNKKENWSQTVAVKEFLLESHSTLFGNLDLSRKC